LIEYRLLGGLVVTRDGRPIDLGGTNDWTEPAAA